MEKKKKTAEEARELAKKALAAKKAAQDAKQKAEKAVKSAPVKTKADAEEPEDKPAKADKKPSGGKSSVKGLRAGAIVLWVLAIAAEVGAFFALRYVIANNAVFGDLEVWLLIGALVVDALCCIVAAQLWKKSNRIRPCLADSKLVRTLWHQLGVIMVLVCFIPIGIFLLYKSKDLNKKLKSILLVIFALLFVGATAVSVDYTSEEKREELKQEAIQAADGDVYWTRFGKSYHFDLECPHISGKQPASEGGTLYGGTIEDAFAANRWDPCDTCAYGGEAEAVE